MLRSDTHACLTLEYMEVLPPNTPLDLPGNVHLISQQVVLSVNFMYNNINIIYLNQFLRRNNQWLVTSWQIKLKYVPQLDMGSPIASPGDP